MELNDISLWLKETLLLIIANRNSRSWTRVQCKQKKTGTRREHIFKLL